jgi:hypothetical protein
MIERGIAPEEEEVANISLEVNVPKVENDADVIFVG